MQVGLDLVEQFAVEGVDLDELLLREDDKDLVWGVALASEADSERCFF